jgi:hypothetical protein
MSSEVAAAFVEFAQLVEQRAAEAPRYSPAGPYASGCAAGTITGLHLAAHMARQFAIRHVEMSADSPAVTEAKLVERLDCDRARRQTKAVTVTRPFVSRKAIYEVFCVSECQRCEECQQKQELCDTHERKLRDLTGGLALSEWLAADTYCRDCANLRALCPACAQNLAAEAGVDPRD